MTSPLKYGVTFPALSHLLTISADEHKASFGPRQSSGHCCMRSFVLIFVLIKMPTNGAGDTACNN